MTTLVLTAFGSTFLIVGTLLVVRARATRRADELLDLSDPPVLLANWIQHSAAFNENTEIHRHIVKHAGELLTEIEGNGTFETWSASMHNLLAIFDAAHGVSPSAELRLERMTAKYLSNPTMTAPPAPIPERIVQASRGPTIEARRKAAKERVARMWGNY